MKPYLVNQLLEWTDEGRVERVLWVHPAAEGLYSIDISSANALPIFRNAEFMEATEAAGGVLQVSTDPWFRVVDESSLPEKHRNVRDRAWATIRPLVLDQPAIFNADHRGKAIKLAIVELNANKPTLYRLLRRYWQRGLTPNALLPDYDKCGGGGREKATSGTKRGRPRLYGDSAGINVDEQTRGLFRRVATRYFAENSNLDFSGAYHALVRWHYSSSELDEHTGRQMIVPVEDRPTLAQFRYWFNKDNNIFQIERTRRTPRIYDKDMRALLGSSSSEVFGPGARFQIDATIADIYLVSRCDRNKIVGRPVLYVVIDVFSRMIVGLYIGFEGPSWVGAMMALANTASDKVEYCRQFGVEVIHADWPCQALPNVLLGDRGELSGKMVETLIQNLHVHVENAAPYRADWKGIVEQRFRLLPAEFKPYVPGYIQSDYRARGGEDYRLDATLDIDQFTRAIIACVLHHNNVHCYRQFHRDTDMIADSVKAIPIELWEWGIARRSGRLRSFPEETVKLSLLPSDEALVTASGIRYYDCLYSCQKALEEHWFDRARQQKGWKVRISYEPRCMDEIYIHDGAGRGQFLRCSLTELSAPYRGKTLWEIDQIRQGMRRQKAEHHSTETMSKINLIETFNAIVTEAAAMKAEAVPPAQSKRQRTAGIRSNRAEEKAANRNREAFRFIKEQPADGGKVLPFPGAVDDDYSLPEVTNSLRNHNKEPPDDR